MATSLSQSESGKLSGIDWDAVLPFVGRIFLSAIFLISGAGKVAAPAATVGYIATVGLPLPQLGLAIAVIAEMGGGLALMLGYRTRLSAAVLAVFSLTTAAIFHNNFGDQNQLIHFLKNVAMSGGLLQVLTFGPGLISLDARQRTR